MRMTVVSFLDCESLISQLLFKLLESFVPNVALIPLEDNIPLFQELKDVAGIGSPDQKPSTFL